MVFLDKNFNYEPYLCNGCHDLIQKAMNFNDVAIVSIKENDYRINFWYMSKNDAISVMNNSNLNEKNWIIINFFSLYIWKMSETTSYERNRDVILNRAKDYYESNKELLREREREREQKTKIERTI